MRSNTGIPAARGLFCGVSVSMMIAGAGLTAPSLALAAPAASADDVEAVVVTGTRLAGFNSPTPVTSLSGAELQANGAHSVADLVTDIPELRQRRNTGQVLLPVGSGQIDLRGLNGVNAVSRTLVLFDGRRMAPTTYNGWVDGNVLPTSLLKSVEVVTGGASAAYGSDAVAGVVNFILDRKFEGFKGDIGYGASKYDDFRQPSVSLAAGTHFMGERGHIIVSGEVFRDSGLLSQNERPWGRENWSQNSTTRNGLPYAFFRANSKLSQITEGGVTAITAPAALQNIQFGPGGAVLPFNRGTDVGATFMTGGDGIFFDTQSAGLKIKRKTLFSALTYDFNGKLQFVGDILYSKVDVYGNTAPNSDSANAATAPTIQRDNAFLPATVRAIMVANNIASFRMGRWYKEEGAIDYNVGNDVSRYSAGFKGKLGEKFDWDSYVAVSRTNYSNQSYKQRNNANFLLAVDTVINPANGQPICRSTLTNPNNNCVPINLFGPGSESQSAINYVTGTSTQYTHIEEDVWATTLRGTPFHLPAGDVSFAAGFEVRRDALDSVADAVSKALGFKTINGNDFRGEINVKEAFGEVAIPILTDTVLAKKLDVNFAGRVTDYSTSGTVTTWKAGGNYAPTDWVRLRGTVSRDIRAPTIFELYRPPSTALINVLQDPITQTSSSVSQIVGGNGALTPEIAKTYTVGVVLTPGILSGFKMSVDYYKINIADVITTLTLQQTMDQCYKAGNQTFCALINRNKTTNQIETISGQDINSASLKTAGVDIEAQYRTSLDKVGLPGSITLRSLASYTEYRRTTTAGVVVNLAGQNNNGIPYWKVNSSVTWDNGPIMLRASTRYMSSGLFDKTKVEGRDIENNHQKGTNLVDLAASYRINRRLELYANVNNLFNVWPEVGPNPISEPNRNGGLNYDMIGQWFGGGVRFTY